MPEKLKAWFVAARLRTLPLAFSAIGMGGILAAFYNSFNLIVFVFCLLTTFLLQVLSNFANDYGDYVNGADSTTRKGPQRMVQSGIITLQEMKVAVILFSILSFISGVVLLYLAFTAIGSGFILFLFLGIGAIVAAIKYTAGSNPYGYAGFGDLFVFVFFGLVGVTGTFYLQKTNFSLSLLLPAAAIGFFSVAVLNVNNIRDIESDKEAGKYSIPVRIGEYRAKLYHLFLLSAGMFCAIVFTLLEFKSWPQFLFLLSLPLFFINGKNVWEKKGKELDPLLKQMALSTLIFVLLFGTGYLLSIHLCSCYKINW